MISKISLKYLAAAFLITSLISFSVVAQDVNSNAGTSAFPFLKINVSARSVSMGGAFTGLANDESALYYNPAGIAGFEQKRFILGYHNMYADMQSGFIGMVKPIDEYKAFGFYINYLNYGDFINTDISGNTLGEFGGSDLVAAFAFAYKTNHYFSIGAAVKFIYQKLDIYSASGLALDIGGKYTSDRGRFGAGMTIQNLGFQLSALGSEKDKLPLTIRTGFYFIPRGLPVTLVSDLIVPIDNDPIIALGLEYVEIKPLFLRLGWNSFGSNYRTADSEDSWAGIAFGVGFDIRNLQFSYAFTPAAELGESHRITLTGGF